VLTRLRVDGFKNLRGVDLRFGPFTCIAGPNGVGKSNLFDAIRFLSLLADHKIMDAARRVRGSSDDPSDPRSLFARASDGHLDTMSLEVETLVPRSVTDAFGGSAQASITFLRYRVELRYQAPSDNDRFGRVVVVHEQLDHINLSEAKKHLPWPHAARNFRERVAVGRRSGTSFISTDTDEDGRVAILTHQDGGSRGQPRRSSAALATATTVGATSSVDDPTIFALKQEMLGWRFLGLEPSAMRRADKYWDIEGSSSLAENGAHIPGTLWSLGRTDDERAAVYAEAANRLSALLPVEDLRVVANDANQQYELELRETRGPWMGARALSEGTLRFLALATLAADPNAARVLCMEEPENGIHPLRVAAMLDLLRSIAVDPSAPPGPENPVRQVIVNTHSPRLVAEIEAQGLSADLLVAEPVTVRSGSEVVRTVRFRHRLGSWRASEADPGVGPHIADAYLTVPAQGQVELLR
jgi:predicted ATPase